MTAEKEDTRYGRQTPTKSFILEYTHTKGPEAIELYNKSDRQALQWQAQLLYDIMAVRDDGLWTHTSFGWSVPRRNGKSEILIMREIWGLLHGEKILHTAHLAQTAHATFERLCRVLTAAGCDEKEDFQSYRRLGAERIEMLDGTGGEISFRTRTARGALGEGFDLLVVDEAQEHQSDQETALKYVISDSKNPQLLMCGTPPTTVSAGTVFPEYRQAALAGSLEDCGWAEWSVDRMTDPHDAEAWYETNPSMGNGSHREEGEG